MRTCKIFELYPYALTSTLHGGEWPPSRPGRLSPGKKHMVTTGYENMGGLHKQPGGDDDTRQMPAESNYILQSLSSTSDSRSAG
jgi:hypothetical protein